MKCVSLSLRTNSKIISCKSRQDKIQSDKVKVYYWHEYKICCLLFWRQNVTYAKVGCEIVRYYPNNIQKGSILLKVGILWGKVRETEFLE
jgi:hypothetical protein